MSNKRLPLQARKFELMDNREFNIRGRTKEQLLATLQLAALTEYNKSIEIESYSIHKDFGFILNRFSTKDDMKFPTKLSMNVICDIVWSWLHSNEALQINLKSTDVNYDHDGSNSLGFRVYCETWGHVNDNSAALVAITPSYCWYGK